MVKGFHLSGFESNLRVKKMFTGYSQVVHGRVFRCNALLFGLVCEYFVNPIAVSPFQDRLTLRIHKIWADALLKKRTENFTLSRSCLLRT